MPERVKNANMSAVSSDAIAAEITKMVGYSESQRRTDERHWYDNNMFDDGHHFRFVSRTTGRIVDLAEKNSVTMPQRAIPKASRQIRGMANLLLSGEFMPIVRPDDVSKANYSTPEEYQQAIDLAKQQAKRRGHWLREEWANQHFMSKLAQMLILTSKNHISYMQVWPDPLEEKIRTQVYDAFDWYLVGNLTSIYDSPYLIKGCPKTIAELKANPNYDPKALEKLSPDNKYASSTVKQAYLNSKFGTNQHSDHAATLILYEAFIKEYLDEDNVLRIGQQEDGQRILEGKKMGDLVIRQVFAAGEVTLRDRYTSLPDYPVVDLRLEPGPIYGPALIERFMPANKSLDVMMSRGERFANTMTTGTWMKRKGEGFSISNVPGGQVIEYDATMPVQGQQSAIPGYYFALMDALERFIEEQGVTTTSMGKLPKGVKANAAIESLKASEFSNLKIPLDQIKDTVRRIAEKMMDIADNFFFEPQTVRYMEKGEPQYFDIIGAYGYKVREQLAEQGGDPVPEGVIPISRDAVVDIQVETGLGFTPEGKRASIKEIMDATWPMVEAGFYPAEAFKVIYQQFLETYQFGNVSDVMDALEAMPPGQITEDQIQQMKVAMAEVISDLGTDLGGDSETRIMENKVGMVEAMKDTGLIDKLQEDNTPEPEVDKGPSRSISLKDLPPTGQVQLAEQAGIEISEQEVKAQQQQQTKAAQQKAAQAPKKATPAKGAKK